MFDLGAPTLQHHIFKPFKDPNKDSLERNFILFVEVLKLRTCFSLLRGWVIYKAESRKSPKKVTEKNKRKSTGKNTWMETGKGHFQVTEVF